MSKIEEVAALYRRYRETDICQIVCPADDMLIPNVAGNLTHYMSVGRSAIDIVVSTLVATNNPTIKTVLDLPCGGGRVTRHLRALFPESKLFVSDLDKQKEQFVLEVIGANQAEPNPNFVIPPLRNYDLIFVGSLLTHVDERRFRLAVRWFIDALSDGGVLIMTAHGRRHSYVQDHIRSYIEPVLWEPAMEAYERTGFGYADYPNVACYGSSIAKASWIAQLIEERNDAKLIAIHEAAWDRHQDAIVVQKYNLLPA